MSRAAPEITSPLRVIGAIGACFLAILLVGTRAAFGQSMDVGTEATAEIATWNVEWFGSEGNGPSNEPLQLENAVRVITESDVDLWALQEMDSPAAFDALLAALGPAFDGRVGTGSTNLHMAFVYRADRVRLRRISEVLTTFSSDFAGRPPLRGEFDFLLPDTTVTAYVFSIHMKARSDAQSYSKRRNASERLKSHIDFALAGEAVVVAGDFNDELQRSITGNLPSPYANFLADPNYTFLTEDMEAAGTSTFCGSSPSCTTGSTIDHLLANRAFLTATEDRTDRLEAALAAIDRFVFTTSDHLPVYARITFGTGTSREPGRLPDPTLRIYPNPARTAFSMESSTPVRIRVFDVTGRKVGAALRLSPRHRLDVSAWPTGLYIVRAEQASGATASYPLAVIRN